MSSSSDPETPKLRKRTRASAFRRARDWLLEFVTLSEVSASSRRGRNQLRIAVGLGTLAASGFCFARLVEASPWNFGFQFWTFAAGAIIMLRMAIWLFLKVEGGRE